MALISLFLALWVGPAVAESPAVDDEVPTLDLSAQPLPRMPGPSRSSRVPNPPLLATTRWLGPRIDGTIEGAWKWGEPAQNVRNILYEGAPDPAWFVRVFVSDSGLAVALGGVPKEAEVVVTVDPDASRRGWLKVSIEDGTPVFQDCRATPDDAQMPVPRAWSVATWNCTPAVPANAVHGDDGWELALPWSALGPTTDDLQLNVRIIHEGHSLSLDPTGVNRDYTGRGRTVERRGVAKRNDRFRINWDRTTNTVQAGLRADVPKGGPAETWAWSLHFAGERLAEGHVTIEPGQTWADFEIPGVEPTTWPYLVAHKVDAGPLGPGAWRHLWDPKERGTLATPVFEDHLIARIVQDEPLKQVPVEVRDAGGQLIGRGRVDLPRGRSDVRIEAAPGWPDWVELRVGNRFVEGWLTAVRAGASERRWGQR